MPHKSERKHQLVMSLMFQANTAQAMEMGYTTLADITDAGIVKIIPGKGTLRRALELAQHVLDNEHRSDFDAADVMAVFCINDAGNKGKRKLTQRRSGGVGGGGVAHALNAAAPAAVSPPALVEWRAAAAAGGAAVVPVAAETEGRLRRPVRSTAGHHPDFTAGPNPPPPQRKTKRPRTCR